MARTVIATDNFNRAALGTTDWAQMNTAAAGDIQINASVNIKGQFALQGGVNFAVARWIGAGSASNDQYSELTVVTAPAAVGTLDYSGVACRMSGSAATRTYYTAYVAPNSTTSPKVTVDKWVNGVRTQLATTTFAWAAGDRISMEVVGTSIKVYKNVTTEITALAVTDAAITTGSFGVIQAGAGLLGDDWEGGNITAGGGAAVISLPTATSPGTTTVTAGATTDTASGTLYQLARIGGAAASAATIIASGQSMAVSTTTPSRTYTGLTPGTTGYVIDMVQVVAGVNSNVVSTAAFNTSAADTTAPTLTSPTGAGGSLVASAAVTTDEANGTLYTVFTVAATAPTAAQVKLGQNSAGAAALRAVSQAVTATGVQNVASGAVTAGTRYAHFMHEDAATNQSAVVSSTSFVVTAPATAVTLTLTTDGTAAWASQTGLKWAFWPVVTPDLFTAAPAFKGAAGTTNASGVFTADITGTSLQAGQLGYLTVTNSDGTVTQGTALRAFSAPVTVS